MHGSILTIKLFKPSTTGLNSNTVRINLIYNGLHFPNQNYVFGIGAGNMKYYLENYGIYPTKNITDMHNYWIEILVDYGIVIFVPFLICYFIVVRELIKKYIHAKDKKYSMVFLVYIFFTSAFLVGSISSSNNLTKEWIWILAGIILAIINNATKDIREVKNE